MRHTEDRFEGAGGVDIFSRTWMPDESPGAIILVVHGAAEHGGRYARFAEYFTEKGYGVAALDHIGHGLSGGSPGYVGRFADYVDTLDIFCRRVQQAHPGVPLVLVGHSMGGLISCCYLLQNQAAFLGCVLSGPAIKTELEPPWWQSTLIRLFSLVLPTMGVLQLDASGVSRDPEVVRKYREDPLVYTGKLSARKVAEMFGAMQHVQEQVAEIRLPLLLLHGGEDALTAPAGSQFLYDNASTEDKTLKIYPGLYHEIFNEPERAQVFADIEAWLVQRLRGAVSDDGKPEPEASVAGLRDGDEGSS